jgi:hypothetical protein
MRRKNVGNNHAAVAHTMQQLVHDIHNMSPEDLQSLYGIEMKEGGAVLDTTHQQMFPDIQSWVAFSAQQDITDEYEDHMRHKGYNNDEEY